MTCVPHPRRDFVPPDSSFFGPPRACVTKWRRLHLRLGPLCKAAACPRPVADTSGQAIISSLVEAGEIRDSICVGWRIFGGRVRSDASTNQRISRMDPDTTETSSPETTQFPSRANLSPEAKGGWIILVSSRGVQTDNNKGGLQTDNDNGVFFFCFVHPPPAHQPHRGASFNFAERISVISDEATMGDSAASLTPSPSMAGTTLAAGPITTNVDKFDDTGAVRKPSTRLAFL